jgi:hypothetical protein
MNNCPICNNRGDVVDRIDTKERKRNKMSNNNKEFKELQYLLEGKTIASIEPPNASEAIAKFVLTDGTAFRLHATDLGFWIEKTAGTKGYPSLDAMMTDYYHYISGQNLYDPDAVVNLNENNLEVMAPDGKLFTADITRFNEYDRRIATHPEGRKILAYGAPMGDMYLMYFVERNNPTCPKELLKEPVK